MENHSPASGNHFPTLENGLPAIGIALGFGKADKSAISPDSLTGAAKLRDLSDYQYEADFKKQGMSEMLFQDRIRGTEKWHDAKIALTLPVVIDVDEPATEGAAVQIGVRCRLLKGNTPVGEWVADLYADRKSVGVSGSLFVARCSWI